MQLEHEATADSIEAAWRALLSPVEAERIGPMTLRLLAHEAAKAASKGREALRRD
jgi:hypothetical protein